ncbi:MAG: flavodoxin family protein [Eubacteriaceae bacterium]|nr:flavodoxin family protein [Eubacteriaceae bacterium]
MVKIIGLSGSPTKDGATERAVKTGLAAIEGMPGVETKFLSLARKNIKPCNACRYCLKNKCGCIIKDDMPELMEEFLSADAYLIGSPVYVHSVTPQIMAFFSRLRPISHFTPERLEYKFGAALSVGGTRNGGQEAADRILIDMMMARGLNVVSGAAGGYIGGKLWSQDSVEFSEENDPIGFSTVKGLAVKLAKSALIFKAGKESLEV